MGQRKIYPRLQVICVDIQCFLKTLKGFLVLPGVFEFKPDLDIAIRDRINFSQFLADLLYGAVLFQPDLQELVDKAMIICQHILFTQMQQGGIECLLVESHTLAGEIVCHSACIAFSIRLSQTCQGPFLQIGGLIPHELKVNRAAFDHVIQDLVYIHSADRPISRLLALRKQFMANKLCEVGMARDDLIDVLDGILVIFKDALHRHGDEAVRIVFGQEADLPIQRGLEKLGVICLHILQLAPRGANGEYEVHARIPHHPPQVVDQRLGKHILDLTLFKIIELIKCQQQDAVIAENRSEFGQKAGFKVFNVLSEQVLVRRRNRDAVVLFEHAHDLTRQPPQEAVQCGMRASLQIEKYGNVSFGKPVGELF